MADFKKNKIGEEDIFFDLTGVRETFDITDSTGAIRTVTGLNAESLPLILATRTCATFDGGILNADDIDGAILSLCDSLASVTKFPNELVLLGIDSFGSGAIITTSERTKLNQIVNIGSGLIITDEERAKLDGLTALTEDQLNLLSKIDKIFPVGMVAGFPTDSIPDDFFECDGRLLDRSAFSDLFGVIGVDYGNVTVSNYRLPDYRGQFLRGWDHTADIDPDAGDRTDRGDGTTGDDVGTKQADEFKAHDHDLLIQVSGAGINRPIDTDGTKNGVFGTTNTDGQDVILPTGGAETRSVNINIAWCIRFRNS